MNKALLESKMKLRGDNQSKLAEVVGLSLPRLNAKLNGTNGAEFTLTEVKKIKDRYNLTNEEKDAIFFNEEVS